VRSVRIRREFLPDHPWIFRKQIAQADQGTRNGDPVRILGKDGKPLGAGLYNGRSQIAIRALTRDPDRTIDRAFLKERLDDAVRLRREVLELDARTDAYRVVNSEGDHLSGLIVDRYGPVLVVQLKCLGFFRLASEVEPVLLRHFPGSRIVYRRDAQAEKIEGFKVPRSSGSDRVEVVSDGIRFSVDLEKGHKTGAFLDQRDSRLLVAGLAKGRRVLDLFCYEGAFALASVRAGAREAIGVDLDEDAVARAAENAEQNHIAATFRHGDAFEVLRKKPETDFLLLDPPRWISSREDEREGRRRYLDLNILGLSALPPGGLLLTSSCSGRLSPGAFLEVLRQAASRTGRRLSVLEVRGAAPDHPVAANFPEGHYLTAVLARVL